MTNYRPFSTSLIGSLPRSQELMKLKRKHQAKKIDDNEFYRFVFDETKEIVALQEKNSIDFITNGELSRDNYVSFIASKIKGLIMMSMGDMLEYIDDKKSFEDILTTLDVPAISIKNAICNGEISYDKPIVHDEMKILKTLTNKPIKATLPGPYLVTRSMWLPKLSGKYYDSKEELGLKVIEILKQEIDELEKLGVDIVQFDEPVLTEVVFSEGKTRSFMCAALSEKKDPTEELIFATDLIKSVMNHTKNKKIMSCLHVCRGNWSKNESILLSGPYTPLIKLFEDVSPDILALEFSTPRAGEIESLLNSKKIAENYILGLGVINPRSDEIESVESIVEKVEKAMKFMPCERIWLNPDCGFATFSNRPLNSFDIIDAKLANLKKAQDYLRNKYE